MANEFANVEYLRGFATGMAMQPLLVTTETAPVSSSDGNGVITVEASALYFAVVNNVIKVIPQE